MNIVTFEDKIINSTYPGRGIVVGMTPDEKNLVQVYWIMGRSENSRNRIFEMDGEFIRTKAYDEKKLTDPSLVIYYPSRIFEQFHIVTNGDQTDTIVEFLKQGKCFEGALKTRAFEPDPPNLTPRISSIIDTDNKTYKMAILKTINNDSRFESKIFYEYHHFIAGAGHCLTTYEKDGNPLPSFQGEPYIVRLFNDISENADTFWNYLNTENRVSLFVKFINIKTKEQTIKIINKNK
ncbi:MAG: IMP cyclohydrolase [Clostridia bacterium]|nr:IMP cyclohydrolase [Clostridia bacterium]